MVSCHAYKSPWINGDLDVFRKTVHRFIQENFLPVEPRWRRQHHPDPGAWTDAGAAGILLTDIPEEYGGGGGTFASEAVVIEELAQAGVHFGSNVHSVVAHYILAYGSEKQKQDWLPRMARGELPGAIAMTEPSAGSDLQGIKTTAVRDGDEYVIHGSKTFITNGLLAGIICVAVKTDPKAAGVKSISLVIVEPRNLPGYRVGSSLDKVGMHAQDTCEIFFDDVRVPVSNLLGPAEGAGFSQMMEQLPFERLTVSLGAVATSERAIRVTTEYVKDRKAFGKTLFDFQNTRLKLAECKTETHIGRVFVDDCIQRFINGRLDPVTAAMAKYWLTDCQCRVVDECVQLHGGYGYMMEYPIARMWVDSRVQRIYSGTNEILKEMVGWSL